MRQDELTIDFELAYSELSRQARHERFEPNADVYLSEDEQTLIVALDVAGADLEGLRVGLDDRHLIIFGKRADCERSPRRSFLMKEIVYGHFLKRIHLPFCVNPTGANASYRNGILTIRLRVVQHAEVRADRTEVKIVVQRIIN